MQTPDVPKHVMTPDSQAVAEQAFRNLRTQLAELTRICASFSEPYEVENMHRRIVTSARKLAVVDGCTLYRLDGDALHFEVVTSDSLGLLYGSTLGDAPDFEPLPLYDASGALDESIVAVRAVGTKDIVNVADVPNTPGYESSRIKRFDQTMGYTTRSILAVPVSYCGGPVEGVLQLVNAKNALGNFVPFETGHISTARCMAGLIGLMWHLQDMHQDAV